MGGAFLALRGTDNHPHGALDLNSRFNAPVYAIRRGIVEVAGKFGDLGTAIVLNHRDGLYSVYGHLSSIDLTVHTGNNVEAGDLIGRVGYTGNASQLPPCNLYPHLHLEIIYSGQPGRAPSSTPLTILRNQGESWAIECGNVARACLGEFIIDNKNVTINDWDWGPVNPAIFLGGLNCWDKQPDEPILVCPTNKPLGSP